MQLITGEFLILALLVYGSKYIRSNYSVIEGILRGCIVFFPPDASSSEKNMTFVSIDDKFSLKSPFFAEFEILCVLLYMTLGLVTVSAVLQCNSFVTFGTSVSFYMILMAILTSLYGIFKQVFKDRVANPENILAFLYSIILFFGFAILINSDHSEVFDFDFKLSSKLLQLQLLASLKPNLPVSFKVSLDFFLLSLFISFLSALLLFPTFRYIAKFVQNYKENPRKDKKQHAALMIAPFILSTLWIKPMGKNLLEGYFGGYFCLFRTSLVVVFCLLRAANLKNEVQGMLNQSSKLVQDALYDPKKENLEICNRKCRAIGTMTWPYAHQSLCSTGLLVLVMVALMSKGGILSSYPEKITEQVLIKNPDFGFDDEEFLLRKGVNEFITKSVSYIKEVKTLEDEIKNLESCQNFEITDFIMAVSRKNLVHNVFYRDFFEFLAWSMCFGWTVATVFSFMILNVSKKPKTS